jgi:hypothetical protein
VFPCIIILYFYVSIFIYAVKSHARVAHKNSGNNMKHSLRVAKGLFVSYILFVVCWLPYGIACIFDFEDKWPRTVHMYTMLFAHMNSSLNPLVYAISNPLFQKGYKNFFNKITFWNIGKIKKESTLARSTRLNTKYISNF